MKRFYRYYEQEGLGCYCRLTEGPRRNEKHPPIRPTVLLVTFATRLVVGPLGPTHPYKHTHRLG